MKGSLQVKNDKFYAVLSYMDSDGKQKRKWVSTGLPVANNKLKAQKMLEDYLKDNNFKQLEKTSVNAIDNEFNPFMKIEDFLMKWYESRKDNLAISTQRTYYLIIKALQEYFSAKMHRLCYA